MKKLLFLLQLLLPVTSLAQTLIKVDDMVELGDPKDFCLSIPKEYTCNNQVFLTFLNCEPEYNYRINIYDKNISLVKSVPIADGVKYECEDEYLVEKRDVEAAVKTSEQLVYTYNSYDEFITFINRSYPERNLTYTKEESGDSLVTCDFTQNSYYFMYDTFGQKYPCTYWRCKNGVYYTYLATYEATFSDWYSVGTEYVTQEYSNRMIGLRYYNLNEDYTYPEGIFYLTQTLFNDDEDFEYIMPKYAKMELNYEEYRYYSETERRTLLKTDGVCGIQILNSNGNVIKDLDFGETSKIGLYDFFLIKIEDITYLAIDRYNESLFYKIERGTTNIQQVKSVPAQMIISPPLVDKNVPISISFSDANEKGSDISIYSSNGMRVSHIHVPPHQKQSQLNINGASGVYSVVRSSAAQKETKKIILK